MKALEFLRKISFREGVFFVMMLVAVMLYINSFVQAPTLENLCNAWWTLGCFFALCLVTNLFRFSSAERAERMQIVAGLCLTLVFLAVLVLAFYYAISLRIIFTGQFFSTLCLLFVLYGLSLAIYSFAFFHYKKRKEEITGGVRKMKNK